MTEQRLRNAFRYQAKACASLGSPFMEQLCTVLADRLTPGTPLTDRLFDWPGDLGPAAQSVPLRLCGALHHVHLSGASPLDPVYPPNAATDVELWDAVAAVLISHAAVIDAFIDSPPQTNEVRRSAALIAAAHWLSERHRLPLRCSELGASAGINLNWHQFGLQTPNGPLGPETPKLTLTPEWSGSVPGGPRLSVTSAEGVDLNPVTDPDRLRAYLWPDQPDRMRLTNAALDAGARSVVQSDAVDWLLPRLAHVPGQTHLIYTTIAWQYFPAGQQRIGREAIEAAGATASAESPLAWLSMENDRGSPGAAVTLQLWPGGEIHPLARIDFHGRWIRWDA